MKPGGIPLLSDAFCIYSATEIRNFMPTVAFIHLDLGIGGAENLVVNAAKGIQDRGHSVKIYTSHHDPARAFKETIDGTLSVCKSLVCFSTFEGESVWTMDSEAIVRSFDNSAFDCAHALGLFHDVAAR